MARTIGLRVRKASAQLAEPNVIPFIDVLLVLLIIFMVTAPKPTTDFNVDLPSGAPVRVLIAPTIVQLSDDGAAVTFSVDGEVATVDALADVTLAHALRNNPDVPLERIYAEARIFVRADQGTAYGNVVTLMDTLRQARFANIGLFAEPAENG